MFVLKDFNSAALACPGVREKTGHRGGASKDSDVTNAQDIRPRYTALIDEEHVGIDHGLNDYAHRDMYELLRFYYRPRAEAYLEYLKFKVDGGDDADKPDLNRQYTDLRRHFIKIDYTILLPPAGCVGLQAVRQALAEE